MPSHTRIKIDPYRHSRTGRDGFSHTVRNEKRGILKPSAKFGKVKFTDELKYKMGVTGGGISLDSPLQRVPHTFRAPSLALTRVLTYLAENVMSGMCLKIDGVAEVQIGWIPGYKTMLVTENQVGEFAALADSKTAQELLAVMKIGLEGKLRTQGTKKYQAGRRQRHNAKLVALLDPTHARAKAWTGLDSKVTELLDFLRATDVRKLKLTSAGCDLDTLKNTIVYYDAGLGPGSGAVRHAELYHLEVFEKVELADGDGTRAYYVAGTKRACQTCAGALATSPLATSGQLMADWLHPGNLWPMQNANLTDAAVTQVEQMVEDDNFYSTFNNSKRIDGYNSDSDSEED